MEQLREYLPHYLISNSIAIGLLLLAWKRPKAARISLSMIFLAASCVNSYTAVTNPLDYLNYERLAVLEIYRKFIRGWFAGHAQIMVLTIAAGQLGIALGMVFNGRFLKPTIVGAVVFLLAHIVGFTFYPLLSRRG